MQIEMTMDIMQHATPEQEKAIEEARGYIGQDGDKPGTVRMPTDFTLRLNQYNPDGSYVRTWIAFPNGRLTWKS